MKNLSYSLIVLVAMFVFFTGCEKSNVAPETPHTAETLLDEEEPITYNFRHQFTGAEMDELILQYTGESAEGLTEEEKFLIMAKIRFAQLTGKESITTSDEAAYRGTNDWIAYAITKLKKLPSTPDNQAIFVDDADVSTTGIQNLRANAGYSEAVPVNYYQIYSFAYVLNDNMIMDFRNQNRFNYTCDGEDFTFAVRSRASLYSSGGTFTQASLRCQD